MEVGIVIHKWLCLPPAARVLRVLDDTTALQDCKRKGTGIAAEGKWMAPTQIGPDRTRTASQTYSHDIVPPYVHIASRFTHTMTSGLISAISPHTQSWTIQMRS